MSILFAFIRLILNIIYFFMKLLPVRDKITFLSRESDTPSVDIDMLCDEFKRHYPEYEVVTCCKMIPGGIMGKILYIPHIFVQMAHLATSRAAILDTYCIPVSLLRHRLELLVVQMWHSVGTMKKFGYSILESEEGRGKRLAKAMRMHHGYDYILCASANYSAHIAEGFGYDEEKVRILPLPRVEKLRDKEYEKSVRARILDRYPKCRNKKIWLYCPTFRIGDEENRELESALNDLIDAFDPDDTILIVKLHPVRHSNMVLKANDNVIIDHEFSSFDMLFIADLMISDYSCIIYEAALRDIPLYFYTFDFDKYIGNRGIYMDYMNEVPGPVAASATELLRAISSKSSSPCAVRKFADKYVRSGSEHETYDMANFVIDEINRKRK